MSLKNILALTLLISFNTYELVQGEYLYDTDLPKINVTAMSGEWFMVASPLKEDVSSCVRMNVDQKSPSSLIMTLITQKEGDLHYRDEDVRLDATIRPYSNLISTLYGRELGPTMAVFDVDYNSYMAVYTTMRGRRIPNRDGGIIVVWSRTKTLSDNILSKIENSSFYIKANKMFSGLHKLDTSICGE